MEKREANYVVTTVVRSGKGKQQLKKIAVASATLVQAESVAQRLSRQYQYASTFILKSQKIVQVWSDGKKCE